MTPVLQNMD